MWVVAAEVLGGALMARTGRPKSDNPRNVRIVIRFTEEEHKRLKEYALKHDLCITETIRKGVSQLLESEQ